jgi:hypothetical protein
MTSIDTGSAAMALAPHAKTTALAKTADLFVMIAPETQSRRL